MRELRIPGLPSGQGERLSRAEYGEDFGRRYEALRDVGCWKLERRQHFEEQSDTSRDALRRGDWPEALRLLDERRDALRAEAADGAVRYTDPALVESWTACLRGLHAAAEDLAAYFARAVAPLPAPV